MYPVHLVAVGDSIGATQRYQGQVDRGMDRKRARSQVDHPTFPTVLDDIRG